ncbi:MAG TPA: Nif3-like dinuclear metal center hexameric protein [Chitinophagaceae bacterium]|nr:Nif3-like dinuclear metal center hexameric protein [Chitinophagaceae bacterium]
MKIKDVVATLESLAPPSLQESYDNAGLITGDENAECNGILVSLDATEAVIDEAIKKNCNLIISHHPIVFSGLKRITGKNYVQKAVIKAIKKEIALYAIHTNLDNIINGVNGRIASVLGLRNISILSSKENQLKKLFTFVPVANADKVRQAIFDAGGGHIGNYDECSFNAEGFGTFKGAMNTAPYVGMPGELHKENEVRIEVIFPTWLESRIIQYLLAAHPYEEVAYDIIKLDNKFSAVGSGVIGSLDKPLPEAEFLKQVKEGFGLHVIKHTRLLGKEIKRVAICGGAGSFLISSALASGADIYITSDIKYHEFFDANDKMIIADIGHYESEQFTINLLQEFLEQKFPTFAVLKTEVNTNPVRYFL